MRIKQRIAKLEAAPVQKWGDVLAWIREHVYYDEISDDDREKYCAYIGIERAVFEDVESAVCGNLHAKLRRVEKPTSEVLKQTILEIEKYILQ